MEVSGQIPAPSTLPLRERLPCPGTNSIGGWVGLKAGLDDVEKIETLHCQEFCLGHAAYILSLYWLSYPDSIIVVVVIVAAVNGV
jgi:hypothetical protein